MSNPENTVEGGEAQTNAGEAGAETKPEETVEGGEDKKTEGDAA